MGVWILFRKLYKPYYNQRTGEIIGYDISNWKLSRRNPIGGGQIIYPNLTAYKFLERYEKGDDLLIRLDVSESNAIELEKMDEVLSIVAAYRIKKGEKKAKIYPKRIMNYNFKDFKTKMITNKKAEEILIKWGVLTETEIESGVTD